MKKILIALFAFSLIINMCFAEYKPIPAQKSQQYKAEIEQLINEEVPKAKKEVDKVVASAKKLHDRLVKNGYNSTDYSNLQLSSEICIWGADGALDTKLIKFTQQKYFGNKYDPKDLGEFYEYRDYLYQNFKENNVNTQKIKELLEYETKMNEVIEGYIKHIQDTVLPPETD